MKRILIPILTLFLGAIACGQATPTVVPADREERMPETKYTPEEDYWPPVAAPGWSLPVPLPYPVNTAGGEDSPFILPDGNTLYFWFTPDVSLPAEQQLGDGVTGIWVTERVGEGWSEPERIHLIEPGKLGLDGCPFISMDVMYFCTTREGYTGIEWFRAARVDGSWQDWRLASDELKMDEYETGELHISADGQELYFHSSRAGGFGMRDIWVSRMTSTGWGEPVNLGTTVNTINDEGYPYLSPDGTELWFTGQSSGGKPGPAVFRSLRQPDGSWGQAEEIINTLAGEPTLSGDGKTLYFTHAFFPADMSRMLEADIYVSYKEE